MLLIDGAWNTLYFLGLSASGVTQVLHRKQFVNNVTQITLLLYYQQLVLGILLFYRFLAVVSGLSICVIDGYRIENLFWTTQYNCDKIRSGKWLNCNANVLRII